MGIHCEYAPGSIGQAAAPDNLAVARREAELAELKGQLDDQVARLNEDVLDLHSRCAQ